MTDIMIFSEDGDFVALLGNKCLLLKKVQEFAIPSKRGRKKKTNDGTNTDDNVPITDASQL